MDHILYGDTQFTQVWTFVEVQKLIQKQKLHKLIVTV